MFVCCSSDIENVILMVLEISLWFHRFISEINFCICVKWTSSEIKFIWFEFMSVYIADIKLMGYEQDCFVSDITIQTIDNRNGGLCLWCIGLMMTEKNCLYLISIFRHVHYYVIVAFSIDIICMHWKNNSFSTSIIISESLQSSLKPTSVNSQNFKWRNYLSISLKAWLLY